MKILSVRFKNLASLAGEWEINFEDPALNSDGIFLITGPTGSGKTTVLDAVCLALYGATPRLGTISSQNEIMSRGKGECQAEVVFETPEGRFNAKWNQNRARNKPGGKLQNPYQELAFESGQIIAEGKAAAGAEIVKRTGLTFDEFTKACLLAQGQFAKFLTEDEDKKAQLLEKITGTKIYADLSRAAHERNALEKLKRNDLLGQLKNIAPLPEAEEREKEQKLKDIEGTLEGLDKTLKALREANVWLERVAGLRKEKATLEAKKAGLEARVEAFRSEDEALTMAKKAAKGDPARSELEGATNELAKIRENILAKEKELVSVNIRLEEAQKNQSLYEAAARAARENLDSTAPLLDSVKKLDAELGAKRKEISAHKQTIGDARRRRDAALGKNGQNLAAREIVEKKAAEIQRWLTDHQADGALRETLGTIEQKLSALESGFAKISELERLIEVAREESRAIEAERTKANDAREKIDREWEKERTEKYRLEEARLKCLKGFDPAFWEQKIIDLDAAYKSALAWKKLDVLRRELRPDQPCPLCGSLRHPWAGDESAANAENIHQQLEEARIVIAETAKIDKAIVKAEKEALTKNGEKEKIMERSRGLASRKEVVEAGADERLREKAAVQTELEKLKLDISQSLAPLGLNHGIITQDIRGKLVERRDAWLAKDKESRTTRDELEKLTREAAAGEATLKACDEELANLEKNLNRLMLEESGILADRRRLFGDKNPEEEAAKLKKAAEEAGQRALDNNRETNRLNVEAGSLTGAILEGKNLEKDREAKTAAATVAWAAFLTGEGMSEEEYFARRKTPAEISRLEEKKAALAREQTEQTALFKAVSASLAREEERNLTQASSGEIIEAIAKAEEEVKILHGEKATLERDLETQLKLKQQFREVSAAFEAQDRECAKWEELDALIGSSEGKIFRDFAQNVTLDFLLKKANRQLTRIIDRYELVRSPDKNLSIQVIDNYHGGERRPVSNLSGGESFIVSLSLALGLSAIASRKTSIDSIFLDEGFGSLDSDTLETAMTALQSLRSDNKLIGIISHVEKVKGWSMPKIETRAGKRQGTSELFGEASQTYIKRHG